MDNDFGIEREQEALAELDKIREAFAGRSPSEPPEETPAVSSEDAVAAAFMASRNVKDQTEEPAFEAAEAAETAEAQPEEPQRQSQQLLQYSAQRRSRKEQKRYPSRKLCSLPVRQRCQWKRKRPKKK